VTADASGKKNVPGENDESEQQRASKVRNEERPLMKRRKRVEKDNVEEHVHKVLTAAEAARSHWANKK
jgi:hypothetical protein